MKISINLDDNDWGQIIDGLSCRAEQYEETTKYHETGRADEDILEVRDADEAHALAMRYLGLVREIRRQLAESKSRP